MTDLITMTKQEFSKVGKKWELQKSNTEGITSEIHDNIVKSSPFMRRLGGKEINTKSYTSRGYKVIQNKSVSPCGEIMIIRSFSFE